ncbi:MAG: hypothetical protein QOH93_103, partial [Chloroflexia bacterium]|nr:hypothetical protein [Chloroflexia bacterium]
MSDYESFGQWLRQRRRVKDLTQEQLADRAGCALETIRKIEVGTRRPSRQMAEALAATLGVSDAELPDIISLAREGAGAGELNGSHQPGRMQVEAEAGNANGLISEEGVASGRAGRYPISVPMPRNSFVGRVAEVERIIHLLMLTDTGLVTLTGPPGIGKTRLGIQVASLLPSSFRDGIYFVPLAPVSHPGEVLPAIARALGIEEVVGESVSGALKGYLEYKQALLILDNFEHVLNAVPAFGELLALCPKVKVLVTSRALLRLYGEREFRVPPLSVPGPLADISTVNSTNYEAVELFTQRAVAADPLFKLTDESAPVVAEICRRLDALPLAIELAAARCRVLAPHAILSRLSNRLTLLAAGGRDVPSRQQTLREAIAWSYGLLDAKDASLFRRLSVFADGATLEAIETVCLGWGRADPDDRSEGLIREVDTLADPRKRDEWLDALDGVTSLLNVSLLERVDYPGEEPRFRMLGTIQEFSEEMLNEAGEGEVGRLRHACYYLEFVEAIEPGLMSAERESYLRMLENEHDNLRATLGWSKHNPEIGLRMAGALGWFWSYQNYFTEGRRWLEATLAQADDLRHTALEAKAQRALGWLAN